jgi:transposase-like protein
LPGRGLGIERCISVTETKLRVKKSYVYVWSAVDVDSKKLPALEASYGRSSLNALSFLKKALKMCTNKPLVIVDEGPWYRWTFERLGLEYRHERFGIRNRVERFFRYLKERTMVFHHNLSARNHIQGINNLNLFTIYYQVTRAGGEQKYLFGHYLYSDRKGYIVSEG